MRDLETLGDATAALRTAVDGVEEEFGRGALRVAVDLLSNAMGGNLAAPVNAALVNDLAFLFDDVASAAADLTGTDAARISPIISAMEGEIAALRNETALPVELLSSMEVLRANLAERRDAIQRQTFVEGGRTELPHPPAELRATALQLRPQIASAGFATPALDALIDEPEGLTFRSCGDLIDELEVIGGV
jgi:hypothetical protein